MDENERSVVDAIGRGIVAEVAPAELPMYGPVARAHARGARRQDPSKRRFDDPLGFGAGQAVVLMAPVAVMLAEQFWTAFTAEAATASARSLAGAVRRVLGLDRPAEAEPLTAEQLAQVREVATGCAQNLTVTPQERALFVDALVGLLAVPPKPAAPPEEAVAAKETEAAG